MENKPILEVRDLTISFSMYTKGLKKQQTPVITHLDLTARTGEILAVAGSSGSGKSLLAAAVLGILPHNARMQGAILYDGEALTPRRQKQLRGREIMLVPQSVAYLDPMMKVGRQVAVKREERAAAKEIFRRLDLPEKTWECYPFALSGGMARRVLVSTAMLGSPRLVIADEPTPGMSLQQAREALRMFRELADQGCAVILITHDIDLAFDTADRVSVFYAGTTLETEPAEYFRTGPEMLRHPYSRALWQALPQNGFRSTAGVQPGPAEGGCPFAPRCQQARERCRRELPPMITTEQGEVRCFYGTEG